ncbi:GNAT family N-acetyltransferase [Ectobacillus sp. JY-23]|uniref:GNAT family N-acetyltransferase n=1 Tax=Ectobacillus sp. JY-23 TaxID=2933872 RepID=UPI001FF4360B|nr:GNAT family N-acetyltransferase [Ectobacillus sp. JY-23]UOY92984.1 GNAT family N-acetyltransferase [Ectobacillus sp. JY-23]
MQTYTAKNGVNVYIREAVREDAQNMIDFYNVVGGESDFLSFGSNEFNKSLADYQEFVSATKAAQSSIILLAFINDHLAGIASITSGQKARNKHNGTLGIVVAQAYTGMGIGRYLLQMLIQWARENGITKKINLIVSEPNTRAISLYRELGFQQEGILKHDAYINGVYIDAIAMGLWLGYEQQV